MLDYFLYRLYYVYFESYKGNDKKAFSHAIYATSIMYLFIFMWLLSPFLILFPNRFFYFIVYLVSYFIYEKRCMKKKAEIFAKYRSCRYNKVVPNWVIKIAPGFTVIFFIVLVIMTSKFYIYTGFDEFLRSL